MQLDQFSATIREDVHLHGRGSLSDISREWIMYMKVKFHVDLETYVGGYKVLWQETIHPDYIIKEAAEMEMWSPIHTY